MSTLRNMVAELSFNNPNDVASASAALIGLDCHTEVLNLVILLDAGLERDSTRAEGVSVSEQVKMEAETIFDHPAEAADAAGIALRAHGQPVHRVHN